MWVYADSICCFLSCNLQLFWMLLTHLRNFCYTLYIWCIHDALGSMPFLLHLGWIGWFNHTCHHWAYQPVCTYTERMWWQFLNRCQLTKIQMWFRVRTEALRFSSMLFSNSLEFTCDARIITCLLSITAIINTLVGPTQKSNTATYN